MKRITIYVLLFSIVLLMWSFSVSAIEVKNDVILVDDPEIREIALSKALEAFPEYSSKIKGEHLNIQSYTLMSRTVSPNLVIKETRMLSDTEIVTYQEYDNGTVLTAIGFMAGKNVTDTSYGTGYYETTMNIWLNHASADQTLLVNNVKYTHLQNNHGAILSKGTIDSNSDADRTTVSAFNEFGDSSGPAYLEYQAIFYVEQYLANEIVETPVWGFLLLEVFDTSISLTGNYSSIE